MEPEEEFDWTVGYAWRQYNKGLIPEDISNHPIDEAKRAFYMGAFCILVMLTGEKFYTKSSEESDEILGNLEKEIEEFVENIGRVN